MMYDENASRMELLSATAAQVYVSARCGVTRILSRYGSRARSLYS